MLLANLLLNLRPLVVDPEANFDPIVDLLAKHDDFAEYEVARHYVASAIEPWIQQRLASPDPVERVAAIRAIRQCFSRGRAAKQLRHLVKDANLRVRGAARQVMEELAIDDVALRDTRVREPANRNRPGGWNPSGWLFGTGPRRSPARAPAAVRSVLPKLRDRQALASWLGYPNHEALVRFMRPGSATGSPYVDFEIPKAKGGTRTISAPRAPLRKIQRQIHEQVLAKVAAHDAAHGFVVGRSTVTNAGPHVGAVLLLKTDIQDFFPTIHYGRVRGLFRMLGYADEVAASLAALSTRRPVLGSPDAKAIWPGLLPQGAPTSPAIANLLCRRLDARLTGFANRIQARYTRYADDLSFSFHDLDHAVSLDLGKLFWWIDQIIQQEGFREHPGKRQVLWPNRRQIVTGIVVNEKLSLPRDARRRFRAILHNCKTHGVASQAQDRSVGEFTDYLRGWAAYAQMVDPKLGVGWVAEVESLLATPA